MKIKFLYSSSSGNSTIIETADTCIMIDCGVSYKKVKESYGGDPPLTAILATHEHSDHVTGMGITARKVGCPIYISQKCFEKKQHLFEDCVINYLEGGDTVEVGDFSIFAFSTRHDSENSLGFVITEKATGKKYGHLTDSGSISKLIKETLVGVNCMFLEADYSEKALETYDGYDPTLKDRIASPWGHLSNEQTMEYIQNNVDFGKMEWIAIGHLSHNTNSPEMVKTAMEYKLPKGNWDKIHIIESTVEFSL